MWRNAGIKIIISGTLNWSSVGILGILNFFVLFCFVVFFPLCRLACGIIARSAGLFQNPKQICACDGVTLWEERDRPIAGKGRSKNNLETPAAHLWTSQTSGHWWEFEQGGREEDRVLKITALMTKQQWMDLISWKCSLWSNQTLSAVAV